MFNAVTFETFLKTLLRHHSRDTRMVLVWDMPGTTTPSYSKPMLRTYRAVLTLLALFFSRQWRFSGSCRSARHAA